MHELVLAGIWPPLAVAIPVLALGWWRRGGIEPRAAGVGWRRGTVALALAGGWCAAFVALQGVPPLPAITGTQWLVWGVGAAAVLALVDGRWPLPGAGFWSAALAVTGATGALALQRLWAHTWSVPEGVLHTAVAAVGPLLIARLLLSGRDRGGVRPGAPTAVVALACCAVAGQVLAAGGSALLGQLAGALAVGLGVVAACGLYNPACAVPRGAALVIGLALGGLLLQGFHFAECAAAPLLLVAAAPAALVAHDALRGRSAPVRGLATLALVLLPLAVAVLLSRGEADPY